MEVARWDAAERHVPHSAECRWARDWRAVMSMVRGGVVGLDEVEGAEHEGGFGPEMHLHFPGELATGGGERCVRLCPGGLILGLGAGG
jgi:hypothetical protein